jgi:outer membrane biosynthesis protein TonB
MEVRQFIRPDVAASAIAHLSVLGLVFFLSEVHPFGSVTAEPITVDIVTADQVEKAETKPDQAETKPELDLSLPKPFPSTDSLTKEDAKAGFEKPPAAKGTPTPPQKEQKQETRQAALPPEPQASAQSAPQPQVQPPQQQQPPPPQQQIQPPQPQQQVQPQSPLPASQTPPPAAASSSLGYIPAAPDVTVKYHVLLGLPPALPVGQPTSSGDKPGDGIDATASEKADIASNLIAEFRRKLKTCSKLPASLSRSDNVRVKLRVMMQPDGKLAAEPILIEGTASMKGLELKQGAVSALMSCQPYAMLPADRYREWRVLDLSFTPDDFTSS